jgi:beta-apo-4'-carotenal oxygenase
VDRIQEALARDLGRSKYEAILTETAWIQSDILFTLKNMDKWVKDEPAQDIPLMLQGLRPRIRKDPMGTVLIVGPCNYPFLLTMIPLFSAIAAGNTIVFKPSEVSANCAAIMQELTEAALDPSCYTVVQGSIPQMQALLAERWDKIFFTGSANVGRIIAKAAAVHLTPVVLELGGLNPAIVTRHANPRIVARRLLWAKTMNAGQTCTAQNYILIEKSILPKVMEELRKAYQDFYPNGNRETPDYSRIVSDTAFQRLKSMIDESKGKVIFGGTLDEKERYVEPTFIQVDSLDDSVIVHEAFGPICAVVTVDNVDEAIKIANKVQDTTLSVAVFGTKEEQEKGKKVSLRVAKTVRTHNLVSSDARHSLRKCLSQRRPIPPPAFTLRWCW